MSNLRDALSRFHFHIDCGSAEFVPEIRIGNQLARLFARHSGALRDAAKRVIHDAVQACEEWHDFLPARGLMPAECLLSRVHGNFDKEMPSIGGLRSWTRNYTKGMEVQRPWSRTCYRPAYQS